MTDLYYRCEDQISPGYYADPETQCQVFHICVAYQEQRLGQYSFLCPNGTVFSQQYLVCVWWYDFDCSLAISYYDANAEIFTEFPAPAPSSIQLGTSVPVGEAFSRAGALGSQNAQSDPIEGGSEAPRRQSIIDTEQQPGLSSRELGVSIERVIETQDSLGEVAAPSDLARERPQESNDSTTLADISTQDQDTDSFGPGDTQASLKLTQSQRQFSSVINQGLSRGQGEVHTTGVSDKEDSEEGFTSGVLENQDKEVAAKVEPLQEVKNYQNDQTYEDGLGSGQIHFETNSEQRQVQPEPNPSKGDLTMIQIQEETDLDDIEKSYSFPQRQEQKQAELDFSAAKNQFDSTQEQAGMDVTQDQGSFGTTHEQTGIDFIHNQGTTDTNQIQTGLDISHDQESFDTNQGHTSTDIIQTQGSFDTKQRQIGLGFSQNQGNLDSSQGHEGFDSKQGQEFEPAQKQEGYDYIQGQGSFDSSQKRPQFESIRGHNERTFSHGQPEESSSPSSPSEGGQAIGQGELFPQGESSFDTKLGTGFDSVQEQSRFDSMQEQVPTDTQGKEYEHSQGLLGLGPSREENFDSSNVQVQDSTTGPEHSEFLGEQVEFDTSLSVTQEIGGFADVQQEAGLDSIRGQTRFDSNEGQVSFDIVQEQVDIGSLQEQVSSDSNQGQKHFDSFQFQPRTDSTQRQEETDPIQGFEDNQRQGSGPSQGQAGFDDTQSQVGFDFSQGQVGIADTSGSIQAESGYDYTLGQAEFEVTQSQTRFDTTESEEDKDVTKNQAEFDSTRSQVSFDLTQAQAGFDSIQNQASFDVTQSQGGFDTTQSQAGFDVTQSQAEFDAAHSQAGFDAVQNQTEFGVTEYKIRLESSEGQSGINDISKQVGFDPNRGPDEYGYTPAKLGLDDTHSQSGFDTIMGQVGDDGSQSPTGTQSQTGFDVSQEQSGFKAIESQAGIGAKGQSSLGVTHEQADFSSSQEQNGLGFIQTQQSFDSNQGLEPNQGKYESNEMQEGFPSLQGHKGTAFPQDNISLNQGQGGQEYNPEEDLILSLKELNNNLFQGSSDNSDGQFSLSEGQNDYNQGTQTSHASLDQSVPFFVRGDDLEDDRLKDLLLGIDENKTEAGGSQFDFSETHSEAQETLGPISGQSQSNIPLETTVDIISDISLSGLDDTSQRVAGESQEEQQQNRETYNYPVPNESLFTHTGAPGTSSQSDIQNDQSNLRSEIDVNTHGFLNEVQLPEIEVFSIDTQSTTNPQELPISVPQDITSTNIQDPITASIQGSVIKGHLDTISSGLQDTSACIHDATSSLRNTKAGILIVSTPTNDHGTLGINTQQIPEELLIESEDGNALPKVGNGIGQTQNQEPFTKGHEQINSQGQLLQHQGEAYSSQGQVFSGHVQTHSQDQLQGDQKLTQNQGQPFQGQEQLPPQEQFNTGQEQMNGQGQFIIRKEQTRGQGQFVSGQEQGHSDQGQLVSSQGEIHGGEGQMRSNGEHLVIKQEHTQTGPEQRPQTFINQGEILTSKEEGKVNIGEFVIRQGQKGEKGTLGTQLVRGQGQSRGESDRGQFLINHAQRTQAQNNPGQFAIGQELSEQAHSVQDQFVKGHIQSEQTFINQEQTLSAQAQFIPSQGDGPASPQQTIYFPVSQSSSKEEQEGYSYSIPASITGDSRQTSPVFTQDGTPGTSGVLSNTHSVDSMSVQGDSSLGMKVPVPGPSFSPVQQVSGDSSLLTRGDSNIIREFPFPLDFIPPTNEYIPPRSGDSGVDNQELLVTDGRGTGVLSLPEPEASTSQASSQPDTKLTTQPQDQEQQHEFGVQPQQQLLVNPTQQQNVAPPVDLEALLFGYLPPSKDINTSVGSLGPSNVISSSTGTSGFSGSSVGLSLTNTDPSNFLSSSGTSTSGGTSFSPSSGEQNFFSTFSGTTSSSDSSGFFISSNQPHSGMGPNSLNVHSPTLVSDPSSQPVYPGAPARPSSVLSLSSSTDVSSSTLSMPSNPIASQKLPTSTEDFSTGNEAPGRVVLPLEQRYQHLITGIDTPRNTRHTKTIKDNKIYVTPLPREAPRNNRPIIQSTSSKSFRPSAQVLPVMNPQEFIPKTPLISYGRILFPQRSKRDRVTSFDHTQRSAQAHLPPGNPFNQYKLSWEPAAGRQI